MQILYEGDAACLKILSEQKLGSEQYRLSRFCITQQTPDGVLAYHLVTKALLLISEDFQQVRQELIRRWFLVPESLDENRMVDQLRQVQALLQKPKPVTNYLIMTTMDCNARCFYCYEAGRERIPMRKETALKAADYILKHSGGEKTVLRWFGGEPLCNPSAIDTICTALAGKLEFTSTMVSNGYLFDDATVEKAKTLWNLKRVQISLDGTQSVYDRAKAYVDCQGSAYQRVIGNIRRLLDAGIRVSIRLNLDDYNARDLLALSRELAQRFPGEAHLQVYVHLLFGTDRYTPVGDGNKRMQALREVEQTLLDLGLMKPPKLEKHAVWGHCMADSDQGVVITPAGKLGKCEHFSETELFGSIDSDSRDEAVVRSWKERAEKQEACDACPLYPVCWRLKKCPDTEPCDDRQRAYEQEKLRQAMRKYYEDWRKTQ